MATAKPKTERGRGDTSAIERVAGKTIPPLKPGDIVFVRHKRGLMRVFLRRIIGSYWDHTALVLFPRDLQQQRTKTIIVESKKAMPISVVPTRGVAIHQLEKYIQEPDEFDVGIARVKGLTDAQRHRVVTFMLMNVDAPYWPWTHWLVPVAAYSRLAKNIFLRQQRFSCSGIIQKAFYDAVDWDEKEKVIFKRGVWSPVELQELTNPADLATSPLLAWVFNPHDE
jgi:hypothetical protein